MAKDLEVGNCPGLSSRTQGSHLVFGSREPFLPVVREGDATAGVVSRWRCAADLEGGGRGGGGRPLETPKGKAVDSALELPQSSAAWWHLDVSLIETQASDLQTVRW